MSVRVRLTAADGTVSGFEASPVMSLLVSAQRAGVRLRHDCGGKAQCGTCRVRVESGSASPVREAERVRLEAVGAGPGVRLACQARPGTDMAIAALLPPANAKAVP